MAPIGNTAHASTQSPCVTAVHEFHTRQVQEARQPLDSELSDGASIDVLPVNTGGNSNGIKGIRQTPGTSVCISNMIDLILNYCFYSN